jgi:glucokinase
LLQFAVDTAPTTERFLIFGVFARGRHNTSSRCSGTGRGAAYVANMTETEHVLAFDIGGTKLAAAVVDSDGGVAVEARTQTIGADGEALYAQLESLGTSVVQRSGNAISAVGAGCGGPMQFPSGVVSPLHIPQWREFPLRDRLARSFGVQAIVDNDAKAMAFGEWWRGAGRGSRNMLGMVVSTGVGGGLVVDGKLLDGEHGHAGHIGHVNVEPEGPVCNCGARGCLTGVASGRGIARRIAEAQQSGERTRLKAGATAEDAAHAAREGDALAARLFAEAAAGLGRGIASAVSLLDLDLVVIGGSIAIEAWDLIGGGLEAELRARAKSAFARNVRVTRASLGHRAGLVGAAAFALRSRGDWARGDS